MRMAKSPKFSICIPVYNGEKTLERAIKSTLSQTFKDFELIVCDNASTDKTEKIVEKYISQGVKYYKNETNLGMARNWNRCLSLANGSYIILLHDDDALHKKFLQVENGILNNYKNIDVLGTNELFCYDTKKSLYRRFRAAAARIKKTFLNYLPNCKKPKIYDNVKDFITDGHYLPCSSVAIKRAIYEAIGGFSIDFPYSPDEEYWTRILSHHYNIARIRGSYIFRHINDENYEYNTWRKVDFPERYLYLYLKLWEYSEYDQEVLSILTDRWLRNMKNVRQYCMNHYASADLIALYDKYIINVETHKEKGISIFDKLPG